MNIRPRTSTDHIVIVDSGTPGTKDIGRKEIDRHHRSLGYFGIGYHFVIRRDGEVEQGRDINLPGAQLGEYNETSISICIVGEGKVNRAQRKALDHLLKFLKGEYEAAEIVERLGPSEP